MRFVYKPFAIIAGMIAARLGRSAFQSLWAKVDDTPPPLPETGEASTAKVVAGQALQGAVMAGTAAAVQRGFASFFHYLVGAWPKKAARPEPEAD